MWDVAQRQPDEAFGDEHGDLGQQQGEELAHREPPLEAQLRTNGSDRR
jgi:hypothetical protein